MRSLLSILLVGVATSAASAQLSISGVQPCQGPLGPQRQPVYDLGDDVFVRFKLSQATPNAKGFVSLDAVLDIIDREGKTIEHGSGTTQSTRLYSDCTPMHLRFTIGPNWKPGRYLQKITVKDNNSGQQTSFEQAFTVRGPRLAILPPQFFLDSEGKVPCSNGGFVSQMIHFKWWLVGLDKSKGFVDFEVSAQLRDAKGQQTLWHILNERKKETDSDKLNNSQYITLTADLPLESPGDYILRLGCRDHVAGTTTQQERPIRILAPESAKTLVLGSDR